MKTMTKKPTAKTEADWEARNSWSEIRKLILPKRPGHKPKKTAQEILEELRYGSR